MVSSSFWAGTNSEHKYDVFLSYRGVDTGDNFKSHLVAALLANNISTFADSSLCKGEDISPSLVKAIEESRLSVIIFSENYASSKWCLDEAVKIMECRRLKGQRVIPVFYRVIPSQVRYQTGSYGEAFAKHLKRLKNEKDRVQNWREALKQAANLSGWDSLATRPESELIEKIVADILTKLDRMPPNRVSVSLIGIDSRIKQLESLLCIKNPSGLAVRELQMMGTEIEPKLKGKVNPEDTKGNLDLRKEKKVEIDLKEEDHCDKKDIEKLGDDGKKLGEEKTGEESISLRVMLHCEDCIAKVKKIIRKVQGVESVLVDSDKNLVTVKGSTVNTEDLVSCLRERFKKSVEVVSDKNAKEKLDNETKVEEVKDGVAVQSKTDGKQEWPGQREATDDESMDVQHGETKVAVMETKNQEIKDGSKKDEEKELGVEKKNSVVAKQDSDVVRWGLSLLGAKEGEGKKNEQEKGCGVIEKKNLVICKQDSNVVKVAETREMHGGNKDEEGKADTRMRTEYQTRYQWEAPSYKTGRLLHGYIYSDRGMQMHCQEHFRSRNNYGLDGATQMFSDENPNSCSIM